MSTEQDVKKNRSNKRKRKSFMQNARGFAKKGNFGRGFEIDDDRFKYFINVIDALKIVTDTETIANTANNVFEHIEGTEVNLASNQVVSKALESLVAYLEESRLEHCFKVFGEEYRLVCEDRFASHVLQKLIVVAFLRGLGKNEQIIDDTVIEAASGKREIVLSDEEHCLVSEYGESHKEKCRNFVLRTSKFLLNNLEDLITDSQASHIMRTCVLSLAGIYTPKVAFSKPTTQLLKNHRLYRTPDDWHAVMFEYARRLEMWPQFGDLPKKEQSSAVLGAICVALKPLDINRLKHFGKSLLEKAFLKEEAEHDKKEVPTPATEDIKEQLDAEVVQNSLPVVFKHNASIFLLETLLHVAGNKLLIQLYVMLFQGRALALALDKATNFSVQNLLENIKESSDLESLLDELEPHIEQLLQIGHTGVLAALSSASLRLCVRQAKLFTALQKSLHVPAADKSKASQFFLCLVKLKPCEVALEDKTNFVHLHGSLVVQHLLQFNKPIFLVNCILETPGAQLSTIFNTPNGSHIVDAFLQSKFIGEKSREKLVRHLEGFYVDLAKTRHGSRVVEQCFGASNETQKTRIVKELADKSNMLKGTPFGTIIYNNLNIATYERTPAQWLASLKQKRNKPETVFKDILK